MKTIEEVKRELYEFLDLENTKKIAIIADNDEDGLTAAIQTKRFLESKNIVSKVFFYDHAFYGHKNGKSSLILKSLEELNPEKTIFLDLGETLVFDILKDIGHITKEFVIIDHHPIPEQKCIEEDFLLVHPSQFSKVISSQYPTTKIVFDLFQEDELLAAIGVLGDASYNEWKDFVNKVIEKNNLQFEELDGLANMIKCIASVYPEKLNDLFEFLFKTREMRELFSSDFFKLKNDFEELIESERKRFYEDKEEFKEQELILFETKKNLPSRLSNVLARENTETLIIYSKKSFVKGSVRRNDSKVNVGKMLCFAIQKIEGSQGGGHAPAGGFSCPVDRWDEFKENVIKYLNENYVKSN
jgi:single-stranded DNA-specific DHH superfamily exonuclease